MLKKLNNTFIVSNDFNKKGSKELQHKEGYIISAVDSKKKRRCSTDNSARNAISRYKRLKEKLDNDPLTNGNWHEVDTISFVSNKSFNYIDLFSGAGGLSVGFRDAGFKKIVSVETDSDASSTLRNNFQDSVHFERLIEDVTDEEILKAVGGAKIDVVCGGPPCQGFSVAGLRNPDDSRNNLFKEFLRVVDLIRPIFILIENVPGILTMQKGGVYREILHQLNTIGYPDTSVRILEAAEFGVPQLRTRAIFIGNRIGLSNPYPKPFLSKENYNSIESAIDDLKDIPLDASINHIGTKHSKEFAERIAKVKPGGSLYKTYRDAFKRQYMGVPSMTIKENHGGVHIHYELNRVLTAREMARLQTFQDDFIFTGSHKRAYWQIGNAVPCLLAKHLAMAIKSEL